DIICHTQTPGAQEPMPQLTLKPKLTLGVASSVGPVIATYCDSQTQMLAPHAAPSAGAPGTASRGGGASCPRMEEKKWRIGSENFHRPTHSVLQKSSMV